MNLFKSVSNFYTYSEYIAFTENLVAQEKTTGPDQSEEMIEYTKLNLQRMMRWEKTFTVSEPVAEAARNAIKQTWWVISEPWCGDSAQIITQLARIAQSSKGHITFKIILRDENLTIMDQYLTNNSRGIPKLIAVSENGDELFTWGPRPASAQQIVSTWKTDPAGRNYDDIKKEVHLWYARNKGEEVQKEIVQKLAMITSKHLV